MLIIGFHRLFFFFFFFTPILLFFLITDTLPMSDDRASVAATWAATVDTHEQGCRNGGAAMPVSEDTYEQGCCNSESPLPPAFAVIAENLDPIVCASCQ